MVRPSRHRRDGRRIHFPPKRTSGLLCDQSPARAVLGLLGDWPPEERCLIAKSCRDEAVRLSEGNRRTAAGGTRDDLFRNRLVGKSGRPSNVCSVLWDSCYRMRKPLAIFF